MPHGPTASPLPLAEIVVVDDSAPHPAALNMALDEVLLAGLEDTALLRCYRWSRRAVSFGCFGQAAAVRADYPDAEWVRRWTGGGIVEHGRDFTYTLLVPRALPFAVLPAPECYRLIHGAVASALAAAGWQQRVEAAPPTGVLQPVNLHPDGAGAAPFLRPCFDHPVPFDLLAAGRKIAGGAQRRTRRGLLHQGSIQGEIFEPGLSEDRWRGLGESLAAVLALDIIRVPIRAAEFAAAQELAARKYGAESWTNRF